MLRFIVDWLDRRWREPETVDIEVFDVVHSPTPDAGLTRSQQGIRFQREEFQRLLKAVGHWESIEFLTAYGSPIASIDDVPAGPDGGIDCVVRITASTERGASVIAGKLRAKIVRQSY
jgi:hypothetical protein